MKKINWFANIGKAIQEGLPRLTCREDWGDPHDPCVNRIFMEQQDIFDNIIGENNKLKNLFNKKLVETVKEIEEQVGNITLPGLLS